MPKPSLLTRRSFLKTASFASAVPFILPSHVWSAETKPNDRLNLGFIGLGTQGRGLLNGFLDRADVQVLAICEVDGIRRDHAKKVVEDFYAKKAGSNYKGCEAFKDFRELNK